MVKLNKKEMQWVEPMPDFLPEKKKARNVGNCNQQHQVVIDTGMPIPKRIRKGQGKRMPKFMNRKYDAVYILKPNQSTAYVVPEDKTAIEFQKLLTAATKNAKRWIREETKYTTRALKENGLLVVRVWRIK